MRIFSAVSIWSVRAAICLATLLIVVSKSPTLADQEASHNENCIDGVCFGPVFIFIDGFPVRLSEAIGQFACRIFGLNTTAVEPKALMSDVYLSEHSTLILFLRSLDHVKNFHPVIRPPPNISSDSTQFSGRVTQDDNKLASNYVVVDWKKLGCDTPKCFLGGTLQFLESLHEHKFVVDQNRYDSGAYCD